MACLGRRLVHLTVHACKVLMSSHWAYPNVMSRTFLQEFTEIFWLCKSKNSSDVFHSKRLGKLCRCALHQHRSSPLILVFKGLLTRRLWVSFESGCCQACQACSRDFRLKHVLFAFAHPRRTCTLLKSHMTG